MLHRVLLTKRTLCSESRPLTFARPLSKAIFSHSPVRCHFYRHCFYAYWQRMVSSRIIAAKTDEDVAFRVLTADQHPDFRTIRDFRER